MESFRFNYKTAFIALNGELFLPDIKYSFRSSTSKNQDFQENLRRIVKKKRFCLVWWRCAVCLHINVLLHCNRTVMIYWEGLPRPWGRTSFPLISAFKLFQQHLFLTLPWKVDLCDNSVCLPHFYCLLAGRKQSFVFLLTRLELACFLVSECKWKSCSSTAAAMIRTVTGRDQ